MSNDVSRLRRRSRGMSKRQTNVEKYEHAISCIFIVENKRIFLFFLPITFLLFFLY
jgi:hypothetical protein